MNDATSDGHRGLGEPDLQAGAEAAHWTAFAQRWANLHSPVRPHPEDVRRFESCVADGGGRAVDALILGVTPELATMRWPAGSSLVAVDRSAEVVEAIWPRHRTAVAASAIVGQWQRLPLRDQSIDFAIGDGCLTALGSATTQDDVCRELVRVLRPGGRVVMRLFASPVVRETPASVFGDLKAGRIGAFDVFKWRLLMAAPAGADHAVRLGNVFELWADAAIDRGKLADANGWAPAAIDTIDDYRNNNARLSFPPLATALARLTPFFHIVGQFTQAYELAERCPIVLLSRRDDAPTSA